MENAIYPHSIRRDDCLSDLVVLNAINTASNGLNNAIADGTRDAIKAAHDAGIASTEAANRNGIAGIKETADASRDAIRETSRVGSDLANAISDTRSSIERTSLENRLATQVIAGELRQSINDTSRDNLIAIKDNGFAIREEGCKTREVVFSESCKTREEILKGFHQTQLEALKNKCELDARILSESCETRALIEKCCCEQKEQAAVTRALILSEGQKRLETENADLRLKLVLRDSCGGNGNGK